MSDRTDRDDRTPSTEPGVTIDIEGIDDAYRGGERLFGTIVVESAEPERLAALEVSPALEFRGPEHPDHPPHEHRDPRREPVRWEDPVLEPGEALERDFDFELPAGPYRVGAEYFSVEWTVAASADVKGEPPETVRESRAFELRPATGEPYEPAERRDLSCREEAPPPESRWENIARLVLLCVAPVVLVVSTVGLVSSAFDESAPTGWLAIYLFFGCASVVVIAQAVSNSWIAKGLRRRLESALWPTDRDALVAGVKAEPAVVEPGGRPTFRTWLLASHPVSLERIEYTLTCLERYPDPNRPVRDGVATETRFERTWTHRIRPIRNLEPGEEFSRSNDVEIPEDAPRSVASDSSPEEWAVEWRLRANIRKSKYPPRSICILDKTFLVDHH